MRLISSALACLWLIAVSVLPVAVHAADWVQLGYGRLVNNDYLGDFQDRGQTGSYVSSRMFGRSWNGALPGRAGQILEFRLQADIKAPDDLRRPAAGDRPFAGSVSFGLHTHYENSGFEIAMGAETVVTGPQTKLADFQTALHDMIGIAPPSTLTKSQQIRNGIYPGAVVEMGRGYSFGQMSRLRPFVEGRAGVETLIRAGFDLEIGRLTSGDLMVRDGITGQRYRTMIRDGRGMSFVVGADTALVSKSIYLPTSRGYTLSKRRDRARVGVHWQGKKGHGFFGVTYLGKEFTTQASSQLVGSVRLGLKF